MNGACVLMAHVIIVSAPVQRCWFLDCVYADFGRILDAVTGLGLTNRRFKIKVCFSKLTVTCRSRKSRSDFTFAFNPPVLSQFQQLLFGSEFLGI